MMQASTVRRLRRPATIAQISSAAVLAAIVAFGASQAQAQPMQPQGERGAQHAAHHRMAPGMGMGMPGVAIPERLLDKVGASAEQKTRLREIAKAAGDDLRSQREAGQALHEKMLALMAAPQVDAAAAEALRQQQLARHDAVTKRAMQAMLDVQAVLTPAQRTQIAEHMAARHKRMQERGHGHGGHGAPRG
jgi:periplasmic protein CpxP/Spy